MTSNIMNSDNEESYNNNNNNNNNADDGEDNNDDDEDDDEDEDNGDNNYNSNHGDIQSNFDEDFESFFWHGGFVPPPPRPPFLTDDVTSDGPTTCGLCTWSQYKSNANFFNSPFDALSELGLPFILIIVAVLSAIFGAIGMITFIKCKRKRKFQKLKRSRNIVIQQQQQQLQHDQHQQHQHLHQQLSPSHQHLQQQHLHHHLPFQYQHQCCQIPQPQSIQNQQQPQQPLQPLQSQQLQNPTVEQCCCNTKCIFDNNIIDENNEESNRNPEVWIWLKDVNNSLNLDDALISPQLNAPQNYYTNTDGPVAQIRQNDSVVYEEITGVG